MELCDEREVWFTDAETLIRDLEESFSKRGYNISLRKPSENRYTLHVYVGDVEKALIVVEKRARSLIHLHSLGKYLGPYVLKIFIRSHEDLCGLIKLLLMKGGG